MNTDPKPTPSDRPPAEHTAPGDRGRRDGDIHDPASLSSDSSSLDDGCLTNILLILGFFGALLGVVALVGYVYRLVTDSPKFGALVLGLVAALLVGAHKSQAALALSSQSTTVRRLRDLATAVTVVCWIVLVEVGWGLLGKAIQGLSGC